MHKSGGKGITRGRVMNLGSRTNQPCKSCTYLRVSLLFLFPYICFWPKLSICWGGGELRKIKAMIESLLLDE